MMTTQVSRNDVAHMVTQLCDELVALLAESAAELRAAVYREVRIVVAVALYEAGVSEDMLPDVLRRLDSYVATTLRIATPTSVGVVAAEEEA
jgi:hypothetical protein